jgi:hypothetical protein
MQSIRSASSLTPPCPLKGAGWEGGLKANIGCEASPPSRLSRTAFAMVDLPLKGAGDGKVASRNPSP